MIPKLSAPLIKDIRTGEGVLEWLLTALGIAAGATGNLSVSHTATYLTIIAGIKGVRRGLVKVVSLQQSAGIGAPLEPAVLEGATQKVGSVIPEAESVLSDIAAAEEAAAAAQSAPGTPSSQVSVGLQPTAQTGASTAASATAKPIDVPAQ